jgi:hypothetical protein
MVSCNFSEYFGEGVFDRLKDVTSNLAVGNFDRT